jgi:hypothetical protein
LKFFPANAPADLSENLLAMKVRDLLTVSGGHEVEAKAATSWSSLKEIQIASDNVVYSTSNVYDLAAHVDIVRRGSLP